ncbi:hypothetical protein BKA70DRAFT_769606 [Coprinopsis sp. MPI-PUGE-AT-0042]|nr:hypothetical protein BKA70DRAFT_769606 [Coprinopsis sp. MPI-PUGE-AT-0042]
MKNLRKAMGHNEPEVLLGVCLPGDSATVDYEINDEDLDSTLMSHGFEYIDGSRPLNPDKNLRDDEDDGIPNLPRVLDALSAFMWPSMSTQTVPDEDEEGSPRSQVRSQPTLEHIINRDPFTILQALEELDTEFGFDDSNEDDEYHETLKELAAMEQEFPDPPPSFPSMIADDTMTSSPTEEGTGPSSDLSKPFGLSEVSLKHKVSLRFDDDFSAFVTAPPDDNHTPSKDLAPLQTHSGRESPDYDRLHSADPWSPFSQSGSLYHSLGSISDLGDVDGASPEGKQVVD